MPWTQVYDPLGHWWISTLVAALPIVVLLTLLAGFRVRPHLCAMAGALTAFLVSVAIFHMPATLATASLLYGVAFGILKIAWIVVAAVFPYDISVDTGQFEIMKHSVAAITPDRRLQLLLVAFCFGALMEGAAGFGAPVAIAGAFMIGLGFKPFQAAVLNLIANTAPVAWGAIGTPVHTLALVTALPESDLNAMIGRILPFTAIIVPFWLVRAMVGWAETFEVLPAILVVGGSFAATQWFWSNHVDSNLHHARLCSGRLGGALPAHVTRAWPVVAKPTPEPAKYDFNWLSATGTGCFLAAIIAGLALGMNPRGLARVFRHTLYRMQFAVMAISFMLGLGFITRYSGMDAVLGLAFTRTGAMFPFFGTLLGWLGVALTGSDTSSNALFGGLQRITAQKTGLDPILMCAANSAGGVMGKMVDAQSIVVATAATNQVGNEGKIFNHVFWHSVALVSIVGLIVVMYAYLFPGAVPHGLTFVH